ncbi:MULTISPECIES: sulfite exporter TauE/SafE family protein [Marinobacter]|uniref:Probable membrane transporter protein n=1 Tax=Marinobacter suaedae TaxID=3057675 RepID=A0ABT8W4B2_9GAMM|nr:MULTISPECIES: sulfite exporter TauE/SafE family protein [unclassified Marinobacter]MBZ2167181.1 sulfite exporter TauE/SafE family protein [Marinobacter sp. F4216]MDO3723079.1 sulfite exporter TauE/SafE family protein [Marinobacter sp. chi1]
MSLLYVVVSYLALGALAGTLAGLFGIGGGLIIVPVLIFSFGIQGVSPEVAAHLAVGTSLATIVFTSISSVRSHHSRGAVRWDVFRPMAVGIVIGAILGAWTASLLSGPVLEMVIGVFVILVAIKMLLGAEPKPGRDVPGNAGLATAGGGIGWASAIFGIGGGTLTVPFLNWCNVRMQSAVGTSAACGLPIAVAGALSNIGTGWNNAALPEYSLGFIYLPAMLGIIATSVLFAKVGASLAHRLDAMLLKRIFAVFLLLVGLRFLLS